MAFKLSPPRCVASSNAARLVLEFQEEPMATGKLGENESFLGESRRDFALLWGRIIRVENEGRGERVTCTCRRRKSRGRAREWIISCLSRDGSRCVSSSVQCVQCAIQVKYYSWPKSWIHRLIHPYSIPLSKRPYLANIWLYFNWNSLLVYINLTQKLYFVYIDLW